MRKLYSTLFVGMLSVFILSGCITPGGVTSGQNTILVDDIVTICGAMVGPQAEQRINDEWKKYPGVQANRSIIENTAKVLLANPAASDAQGVSDYGKYLTCATGLLVTKGAAN